MKLDLNDLNVEQVSATVDQVRNDDPDLKEALDTALDNAQGRVFTGDHAVAYVVIEIRK